jgi:hypothetical protein
LRRRAMRIAITLLGFVLLAGCSNRDSLIESTDVKTIYRYVADVQNLSGARIVDGADLVTAAYYVVDDRCQKFFDTLEADKSRLLFARSTANNVTTLAVQILTQLTVAQRDIGIVSASGKFVSDAINDYNQIYNFAPYSGQLRKLVSEAQTNYKNSANAGVASLDTHPVSDAKIFFTASNIAQGYARLCTLSQFQLFIETALGTAKAVKSTDARELNVQRSLESVQGGVSNEPPTTAVYLPPYVAD